MWIECKRGRWGQWLLIPTRLRQGRRAFEGGFDRWRRWCNGVIPNGGRDQAKGRQQRALPTSHPWDPPPRFQEKNSYGILVLSSNGSSRGKQKRTFHPRKQSATPSTQPKRYGVFSPFHQWPFQEKLPAQEKKRRRNSASLPKPSSLCFNPGLWYRKRNKGRLEVKAASFCRRVVTRCSYLIRGARSWQYTWVS